MAIYLKCCGKDHIKSKRKCDICKKSFTKFIVKVKDSSTGHVEKVKSVLVESAENGSYQILGLGIGRKPAVIMSA